MQEIKTIAIAGAGTMGAGIAQVSAQAGYNTILFDINLEMLRKGKNSIENSLNSLLKKGKLSLEKKDEIQSKIKFTSEINELKADLIIEAIVENLAIKQTFFKEVAELNNPETILASNTSSIPLTQIAEKISNPERVVGIHFFNPAPVMKLVEIISGKQTNPEIVEVCKILLAGMGKTCVMAADSPGFIVNRVARLYYVESLKILEENVATFEDIDLLLESSGFKMGPFRLMDLIGVDTNFSVTNSIYNLFNQAGKFRPSKIQQQKVEAGFHGKKTGKGFYEYE